MANIYKSLRSYGDIISSLNVKVKALEEIIERQEEDRQREIRDNLEDRKG